MNRGVFPCKSDDPPQFTQIASREQGKPGTNRGTTGKGKPRLDWESTPIRDKPGLPVRLVFLLSSTGKSLTCCDPPGLGTRALAEFDHQVEIYHVRSLNSDCDYQEKNQYKKADIPAELPGHRDQGVSLPNPEIGSLAGGSTWLRVAVNLDNPSRWNQRSSGF